MKLDQSKFDVIDDNKSRIINIIIDLVHSEDKDANSPASTKIELNFPLVIKMVYLVVFLVAPNFEYHCNFAL